MKSNRVLQFFLLVIVAISCGKSADEFNSKFSLFKDYILNFSSGMVSSNSDIRVVLAKDQPTWKPNQELDNDLFDISPSVSGKVIALSKNTVAFVPEEKLQQDTEYKITFNLSDVAKVKDGLEDFNFTIKTVKQDFAINIDELQSYSDTYQYANGTINFADNFKFEDLKEIVEIEGSKDAKLKFLKVGNSTTQYRFTLDSINKYDEDTNVQVKYDGDNLDIDKDGKIDQKIPGSKELEIVSAKVVKDKGEVININFSEPLSKSQDFSGLVQVEGATNLRFATAGNILKVYVGENVEGERKIDVFQGISAENGLKLLTNFSEKVLFENSKPSVRFIKSGNIMPSSNNLKLNFEAVNLSAVDVKVYKIYKNNILQFLQENDLNGDRNLRNVAQPIAKQNIVLKTNNLNNYGKWNAYAVDLSKIVDAEQGAIYRVELSFKKKYSLYNCAGQSLDEEEVAEDEDKEEDKQFDVTSTEDYYYDDYGYYNWEERDNPCSNAYFYQNARIATNILASDIGIITKRGENGSYKFITNNIVTSEPEDNVKIELYNFQQQKLGEVETNSDGFAETELSKYAFFATASKGKNVTYIKLDEGYSLSVSNFNVSGEEVQKGLKGFMYGERGVWRPGDTLYLDFMLNDKESKIEKTHPIKFRLSDPSGKVKYQMVQQFNDMNHYRFQIYSKATDPTGNWEAKVSIGGVHFYKTIKIETIKPNRLKIRNGFSNQTIYANRENRANLNVNWLHGAIAKNLNVEMQAKYIQEVTTFPKYNGYDFDDDTRNFYGEEVNVFSGRLNDIGNATVSIEPKVNNQSPGKLKVVMQTKAYEPGGDFSTDVSVASLSPYKTYVGLKAPEPNKYGYLETDKSNTFNIVTVSETGTPKAVENLEVLVYKIEGSWWWNANDSDLSTYNSSTVTTAYKRFVVSTNSQGKGSVSFKIPEADWGKYLIKVVDSNDGHATSILQFIDWPIWSGKSRENNGQSANMLVFATDKEQYNVGEKAKISFPSTEGGRALISIENGSKVIKTFWKETSKGETIADLEITPEMAPNVFINISVLKPHASTLSDAPIRMYGIAPIEVVDKNTVLEPQVVVPQVLRPEQKSTIKISEKNGKAMTYTVAIVDDGLLDLTNFKTPNAWDKFYAKQALGVKTWDVYDNIIGAYGGKINQIFSIGGDQDLGGGKAKQANRFKPVVIHLGPFKLEKGQTKTHTIKMPNYIGSVRTMVVAGNTSESAYGSAEATSLVKKPLMVLATFPRKISPQEKITIPVTVFATENQIKNVNLSLETSKGVVVNGSKTQKISFSKPDEKIAFFEVQVSDFIGITKLNVVATSGKEKSTYPIEVDVVNPNPATQEYMDLVLPAGASKTLSWNTFGVQGSNAARLEISSLPSMNMNGRLSYLIQYPHGCVEQTTSSVFPQLYLNDVIDLDESRRSQVQKNINAAIIKLGNFQTASGGLSYWQGGNYNDDWGTSYAGHFMMEAEKKGYVLPVGFKNKWVNYQQNESKNWRFNADARNDFAQAYRLYTLAVSGYPDLASMNRLRETETISDESRIRLATAYAVARQKGIASSLLNSPTTNVSANYYDYYGSEERNMALLLETYVVTNSMNKAYSQAIKVAKRLASNSYMSTQTTAYCLYAMSKFSIKNGSKGINVKYTNSGKSIDINSTKSIIDRRLSVVNGKNSVTVKNNNKGTIYIRVLNSGILPVGSEQEFSNNLSANINYKLKKGGAFSLNSIKQGSEIVAEITLSNNGNETMENIALSHIVPSGFEIANTRFTDYGSYGNNVADYVDIRDDRTHFYFTLKRGETKTFTVLLNATFLGKYYLPGLHCEAMYNNEYAVHTKGQWITILK